LSLVTLRVICASSLQGEKLTYTGNTSRSANRVLTALVAITIVLVAWWAISGGLDEVQTTGTEQVVVVED
jgi:hypothetical protein